LATLPFLPAYLYGVPKPDGSYARNFVWLGGYPQAVPGKHPLGTARDVIRLYEDVVYCDSRDPNSAAQVLKWFRYGFFQKRSAIVVNRLYFLAAGRQLRQFEAEGVAYVLFWPLDAVDFRSARAVFYPYHTNTNQIMIKAIGPVHVFTGHGDSDKAGSVNPMTRMYDHVLVSGDLTIQRLLQARVMTPYDAAEGRMVRVGMPYLEPLSEAELVPPEDGYILYAPTWEGVERRQQYSSLEGGFGLELVGHLLEHAGAPVVFRPHPSTGQKLGKYRSLAKAIIDRFQGHPKFHLQGDIASTVPSEGAFARKTAFTGRRSPSASLRGAKWVVTDVSSMLSASLYACRPVAVIRKSGLPDPTSRTDVLSDIGGLSIEYGKLPAADMFSAAAHAVASERVRAERARCVTCEPYLAGLPREEWVSAIVEVLNRGRFRR